MGSQHEAVASAAAALLASIGISPAGTKHCRHADFEIDREVSLAVSDGFTRQTWRKAGKVWTETRDILSFDQGERVRIFISNYTPGVRVISFGDENPTQRVRSGETIIADVTAKGSFIIAVAGQPSLSRPVRVLAAADAATLWRRT